MSGGPQPSIGRLGRQGHPERGRIEVTLLANCHRPIENLAGDALVDEASN
jgi:hypothetical protein